MLIASLSFTVMGSMVKELEGYMNSVEIVFFRNIFSVIVILLSIYKYPLKQKGGQLLLLLFRGFIGFISLLMFIYCIVHLSITEAMTFSRTAPIFTSIFAFIFLHERISQRAWIGVFIGFIGILFITKFTGENLSKLDYLGILSGLGGGLAYTSVRELSKYYESRTIVLSFVSIGAIFPIIFMLISPYIQVDTLDFIIAPFVVPNPDSYIFIFVLGLSSFFAQTFMTKAYQLNKAGIVGAISYSEIVFAAIVSLLVGYKIPDLLSFIGIGLIIMSGLLVSWRNKDE
jgi:drug/metabolite transporter (DMT)-like permease